MRIHKRWVLIVAVAAGQLVFLVPALYWFTQWLEDTVGGLMQRQILADNRQVAAQMAMLIDEIGITDPAPGTPDWHRLQGLIERLELPNEGFLCVTDGADGTLLCHPALRDDPELAGHRHGQTLLAGPEGGAGRRIMDLTDDAAGHEGWAEMPDGTHLVAVRNVADLNIQVLAHQRDTGVQAAVGKVMAPVQAGGLTLIGILTAASVLSAMLVVRRYENRLARINRGLETKVEKRSRSLMKTRDAVIFGLARLAESRDDETGEHLDRIHEYVEALARQVAADTGLLNDRQVQLMALTSSLHDIGKVGIPDAILRKPGRLDDHERERMRRHTTIGGDCLIAIKQRLGEDDFLEMACHIALAHHERWDGSGYPFGLAGEMIPLPARIVAVADVYDALTSRRIYKAPMPHEQAKRIILDGAGTQFDGTVVTAFMRIENRFRSIAQRAHRG